MLLVDGFNQSKMSSKYNKAETKPRGGVRTQVLQTLPTVSSLEMPKRHKQDVKNKKEGRLVEMKGDRRGVLTLPPIIIENLPRTGSLKSYTALTATLDSSLCGHTSRENAIYCLRIAR